LQNPLARARWLLPLLPALVLAMQPLPGGPRPVYWLSALLGLALLLRGSWWTDPAPRRLTAVWACLVVPVSLSMPWSVDVAGSAKILAVLMLALPVGVLWLRLLRSTDALGRFEGAIITLALLFAADGLLQFFLGQDLFGVPLEDGRVVGPLSGNLRMATLLAVFAPLVIYRSAVRSPLLAIVAGAGVLGVSVLSGTRTSMLMLVLTALAVLPAFRKPWHLVCLGALAASLLVATLNSLPALEKASQTTMTSQTAIPGMPTWFGVWDDRLTGRLRLWNAALNMGLRHPTGVGAGGFTEAYADHTFAGDDFVQYAAQHHTTNHAHHTWLALFAEQGLPGVLGLIFATSLAWRWRKTAQPEQRRLAAPYLAALAVYLFPLGTHQPLFIFWWFPVVWLLTCGFIAAVSMDDLRRI